MAHNHGHAAPPQDGAALYDDPPSFPILYATIVGGLSVLVTIILVSALAEHFAYARLQEKVYAAAAREVTQLKAAQAEALGSYRWIDRQAGVVGVPIEQAMQAVVRDGAAPPRVPATRAATPAQEPRPE